jgi:hypothetical protein
MQRLQPRIGGKATVPTFLGRKATTQHYLGKKAVLTHRRRTAPHVFNPDNSYSQKPRF